MNDNEDNREIMIDRPWIEVTTGITNSIVGFDEFISQLETVGSVHKKTRWFPACCTGEEMGLVIKLGVFLGSSMLSGFAYDFLKVLGKKFVGWLHALFDANGGEVFEGLVYLEIEYDDIAIRFERIGKSHLSGLGIFFIDLQKSLIYLDSKGIDNVIKISLPVYGETLNIISEKGICYNDIDFWGVDYFRLWRVVYGYGVSECIYDSQKCEIIEQ